MEASRRGIEADFASARNSYGDATYSRLIAPGQTLPTQFDRQVDVVAAPAIPAGGGSASTPFQIVDQSTTSGTPAAKIKVLFGSLYSPTLGTTIDVTLGGVSLSLAPLLTLGSTATFKIYIQTDLSSAATIQNTTGALPSDNVATPVTYCLLGIVTVGVVGGGFGVTNIQQAINTSLSAVLCSNASNFMWSVL